MHVKIDIELDSDTDNPDPDRPLSLTVDGDHVELELRDPYRSVLIPREKFAAALKILAAVDAAGA